jgi:hypothetical protein
MREAPCSLHAACVTQVALPSSFNAYAHAVTVYCMLGLSPTHAALLQATLRWHTYAPWAVTTLLSVAPTLNSVKIRNVTAALLCTARKHEKC